MKEVIGRIFSTERTHGPWRDRAPIRQELFGAERLEQHAESLAAAQSITNSPKSVRSLHARLRDNADTLLAAYRSSALQIEAGLSVVPAAEWLLDNFHVIEEQVWEIRDDLPPGYYKQLPKLSDGPFAGYPRVFGIAWAFVAHTDSNIDLNVLRRFLKAYQRVQPLTIGELWAVAITLRIVLIENLRRLADQIISARDERRAADGLADRLLAATQTNAAEQLKVGEHLSDSFAAQLAKRLRDHDPATTPALGWLEENLRHRGTSTEEVVQKAHQRQGASNVSVRNVVTSMRLISDIDWADLFEEVSLVEQKLRGHGSYAAMDFATRNLYRNAVEHLARRSAWTELEIVDEALRAADAARAAAETASEAVRRGDSGYHLVGPGRQALEKIVGFRPDLRLRISRINSRLGVRGYIAAIVLLTTVVMALACDLISSPSVNYDWLALFAVAGLIPASEVAILLVNRIVTWSFGPITLPALELSGGVPHDLRTLVVVPALLVSEAELLDQIEQLEIHHLSGAGGELSFALLLDGADADQESSEADVHLINVAVEAVERLNARYEPTPAGPRFYVLYRRRVFNAAQGKWMGWERKRGKLHELNRLLRGATDTTFIPIGQRALKVPADVRYVITLDADTRLPRDAALRLIGKMAHPLNRAQFDPLEGRVMHGYAILQPRVTPSLPVGREGSLYQRTFSGPGGMDPYAGAVSDVYQDLFSEGSYTGKGIYDVDAFEASLAGRIPDNALLSHDLFEGIFARAGLASDVEVVEDVPSRYDVVAKRQHRWVRGDWQLLPWILGMHQAGGAVPSTGAWKMLDNLRRSLVAPLTLATLALCWLLPDDSVLRGTLMVLGAIAIPAFLPLLFQILPNQKGTRLLHHVEMLASDIRQAVLQTLFSVAFLADLAWRMSDAILRTLYRLYVSHRLMLEWTTAAQASRKPRLDVAGFYREMRGGVILAAVLSVGLLFLLPSAWPMIVPFAALWIAAPAIAFWASQAPQVPDRLLITPSDALSLRLTARQTWRYFETFVTAEDHFLPPDNFQETPGPAVAHRTSPTNIGLYFLSTVAARDFGWIGVCSALERFEQSFATLHKLPLYRGHLFNWYATETLQTLAPEYVSSVDSGNLAGHLIVLANACEDWKDIPIRLDLSAGLKDTLQLAINANAQFSRAHGERGRQLEAVLQELYGTLDVRTIDAATLTGIDAVARRALGKIRDMKDVLLSENLNDVAYWVTAVHVMLEEHRRDLTQVEAQPEALRLRLQAIADQARAFAHAMDFGFLLDADRKLLSIGYSVADNRLDVNCYDLLASEARLASLFAIAKRDVPTKHWFRLGRTATPLAKGSALISWSGSMFEYLMPSLVMRAPTGSLLEQTNQRIVEEQQAYGASLGIPWGVSESAYNARDMEFTYQYSNFGVPSLGLKRGLSDNVVIAPYATGLATMVDPHAARLNYDRLEALGANGHFGFYEAVDFTASRLPEGEAYVVVRNYMAHHQGMTIVAIANALQDGGMRDRFHREPMIQASELLLQERTPRDIIEAQPHAQLQPPSAPGLEVAGVTLRRLFAPDADAPVTHLLSNGRYAVMLSASGGGYSRWRDMAITRWREDATRDNWGAFVYLRDVETGKVWSPTMQPFGTRIDNGEIVFGEDHASFLRRDRRLTTRLEIVVSGEDDGEVRRVSVTNRGRRSRDIDVTSYSEIVLAPAATDAAHPAFAKMFVVTEFVAEFGALIATRRPRTADEAPVWAAHFAVVEGETAGPLQYESDRARFLGRAGTAGNARAIAEGRALTNTAGTVLDPVFALRHRLRIAPGQSMHVSFWTLVASSRAELIDMVDRHCDRSAFDRARTLAWTQAQVQLRHLDVKPDEAAEFQRLAAPILYSDPRFRVPSEAILRGCGTQAALWPMSISGDLPIVLLHIDDLDDMAQVRQLLRAHEYWRMKRLAVDLVIINEHATSYLQDLQNAIDTAVRSSQSRPTFGRELARGSVYTLRADLIGPQSRALLLAVARVVLSARRGPIARQIDDRMARPRTHVAGVPTFTPYRSEPLLRVDPPLSAQLEFFNGHGGFDQDASEYVVILRPGSTTPAPWINVVANPEFGFQASAEGSGYTWAANSRENQLTQWSNDAVSDPASEAFYIRDDSNGNVWTPTAQPVRDDEPYIARHGRGYCRFEHTANGIASELLQFVPLSDSIKISRLTLRNLTDVPRRLSVTSYTEWTLGTLRGTSGPYVITELDAATGAMFARNPWNGAFAGRVAFADLNGEQTSWTGDRTEFLGRNGEPGAPGSLCRNLELSGTIGAGFDPCSALQRSIELGPNEIVEVVAFMGQSASPEAAQELLRRYRGADLDAELAAVTQHWNSVLGAVQVKTPDRAMDIMLNGWLLYQTLACRIWARSAFYQASGAYGFRDQLQDGMALTFSQPGLTRGHLLRAAARQFIEGDVQHWWLPHSGQGVRTHISDDRVWLAFATATYIECAGDVQVLGESVPFLEGPLLPPDQHDAFFSPMISHESATLFEHCARGLDQCMALTGELGLPLMGTGDWNDGMNNVGAGGKGESVWLGWLVVRTIALFLPYAKVRDPQRAARWESYAETVRSALEEQAWDGAWYRRATFDDGTWLGSSENAECSMDSIAQSWAVLSGRADPQRAARSMQSVSEFLIRRNPGLALLFAPPFNDTPRDPGYIKGYPPGLRENGGQYSHAAMWLVLAYAKLGDGDRAGELFAMLNPINHARTQSDAYRYKVEPYVVAADVYSVAPHEGRGGWTWYTGSAGWMYRAGLEGILGITREGEDLVIAPCIPSHWPHFEVRITLGKSYYDIRVENPSRRCQGIASASLDGTVLNLPEKLLRVRMSEGSHTLQICM